MNSSPTVSISGAVAFRLLGMRLIALLPVGYLLNSL